MASANDRKLALLAVGLLIGWFVADKGWHRHLSYLAAIALLMALLLR